MAAAVRAMISTPSPYSSFHPHFKSESVSSALSPSFQHLSRLPRKCSPRLSLELSCSSISSLPGPLQTNGQQSSAPSQPYTLSSVKRPPAIVKESAVEPLPNFILRKLGTVSAGSLVLGSAGAALSETTEMTVPASTDEQLPTDYLLSFLFITAFICLCIVTIGAIYLGVTDFLENRQRVAMQKQSGEEKTGKTERRDGVKVGSGKGFGVKRSEKKSEEDK